MEDKINKFSPSRNNLKKQIKVSNKSDRSSCNDINTTIQIIILLNEK